MEAAGLVGQAIQAYATVGPLLADMEMLSRRDIGDPGKRDKLSNLAKNLSSVTLSQLKAYESQIADAAQAPLGRTSIRRGDLSKKQRKVKRAESLRSEITAYLRQTGLAQIIQEGLAEGQAQLLRDSIISDLGTSNTAAEDEQFIVRAVPGMVVSDIMADIAAAGPFDIASPSVAEVPLSERKAMLSAHISKEVAKTTNQKLGAEAKTAIQALERITEVGYLDSFVSVSVSPLLKRIGASIKEAADLKANHTSEYARYQALCSFIQKRPEEFPISAEGIAAIRAAITGLEIELVRQEEQRYISETIDEVMVGMGYDVIGHREVTKKSGKHFRNKLYAFGEGTALSVTFSSDGQIAMELGGIDTKDHIPSRDESVLLQEDMTAFCDDFKTIEEQLMARSIFVGERVSMAPPTADYASIININDYEIEAKKPVATITTGKRRKKSTARKMLRRNGE
jgi:hypothetical protein